MHVERLPECVGITLQHDSTPRISSWRANSHCVHTLSLLASLCKSSHMYTWLRTFRPAQLTAELQLYPCTGARVIFRKYPDLQCARAHVHASGCPHPHTE